MSSNIIVPLAICLLVWIVAYRSVPPNKYKSTYILLSLLSMLIRMAIVSYLYENGTDTFGTDGLLYHQEGIRVAQQLAEGIPFYSVEYSYTWYTVFVGIMYNLFGINRYIVSYINIIFAFFSAILLLKMALNRKYTYFNASLISLVFLYFPNLLLWTADSRKEALLILVCFICWYTVQHFIMRTAQEKGIALDNIIRIIFVCLLIWFCTIIRIYMFAPLAAGIILSQLLLYKKSRAGQSILFAAAVFIGSLIIFTATVNPLMHDYHAVQFPDKQTDSMAEDIGSKMNRIVSIASGRNIIVSIVNYLVLPYPGDLDIADIEGNSIAEFMENIDMLIWYACMLLMATGIYSAFKQRDSCFKGILAFIAAYVFINALVVENVADTILRYRSVIIGASLLFIDCNVLKSLFNHLDSHIRIKEDIGKPDTVSSLSTAAKDSKLSL
ncbi:MAG: hypothetical protein ABFD25_01845 [Clostridiaceae bacterium]